MSIQNHPKPHLQKRLEKCTTGEILSRVIDQRTPSRAQVAAWMDLTPSELEDVETGRRKLSWRSLLRLRKKGLLDRLHRVALAQRRWEIRHVT